jgi:hypothetical protein
MVGGKDMPAERFVYLRNRLAGLDGKWIALSESSCNCDRQAISTSYYLSGCNMNAFGQFNTVVLTCVMLGACDRFTGQVVPAPGVIMAALGGLGLIGLAARVGGSRNVLKSLY